MKTNTFLHCSDLHLGCTPNHLEQRYNDFFDSFKDLIDNAIKNECKYILISGDLFHLKVINSKTLLNVINLLASSKVMLLLSNISFIIKAEDGVPLNIERIKA